MSMWEQERVAGSMRKGLKKSILKWEKFEGRV